MERVVGVGYDSTEIGQEPGWYATAFQRAGAAGLRRTAHQGEDSGPDAIAACVDLLGAERIGHGCSAAADPALLAHLAETGVVLEVCPTSNIATRAVDRIEDHPLRAFVDAGVKGSGGELASERLKTELVVRESCGG